MRTIYYLALSFTIIAYSSLISAEQNSINITEISEEFTCSIPTSPIIPDGNLASEDELISAQKSLKFFQKELINYRDCLSKEETKLNAKEKIDATESVDTAKTGKQVLVDQYNHSVEIEETAAKEFNIAVRTYKERQPEKKTDKE